VRTQDPFLSFPTSRITRQQWLVLMVGWATGGILLGVVADYAGRVRVLSLGVLTYAVCTAVSGLAGTWWQLGLLRFAAGIGSGAEAPVGASLVAETWQNRHRARACGVMMSGYAGGFFLASLVYALLGPYGWRVVLATAGAAVLLVWFLRRNVREPPELDRLRALRRRRRARRGARRPRLFHPLTPADRR
jgi:MFS family permease